MFFFAKLINTTNTNLDKDNNNKFTNIKIDYFKILIAKFVFKGYAKN